MTSNLRGNAADCNSSCNGRPELILHWYLTSTTLRVAGLRMRWLSMRDLLTRWFFPHPKSYTKRRKGAAKKTDEFDKVS
jgi:hypothetical protein